MGTILRETTTITSFVFIMMLVIEYINIFTRGHWQSWLSKHLWKQYIIASFLGLLPGCLGAFAVVTMYSHRLLTIGAVVTTMIATSGDETFVMLALFPLKTLYLSIALFFVSILGGVFTDHIVKRNKALNTHAHGSLTVHHDEDKTTLFPKGMILSQLRNCSTKRLFLLSALAVMTTALLKGELEPSTWGYEMAGVLAIFALATFIIATVSDHFLEKHLWKHVAVKHVPRIFLWTLGSMALMHYINGNVELANSFIGAPWILLVAACLIGLIPESGPHLVFVTLYAQGSIPFSILLASSIVQDGHGMLPMLAHSRRTFIIVKGINLIFGLLFGGLALMAGI